MLTNAIGRHLARHAGLEHQTIDVAGLQPCIRYRSTDGFQRHFGRITAGICGMLGLANAYECDLPVDGFERQ
jgi:hypothetical protein